ncbi:MAG: hypothetical protein ACYCY7_05630 [Gallionella sp.]
MSFTSQQTWQADIGFGLIIVSYLLLVFGSPMPIKIGAIEIVMGVGLIIGSLLLGYSLIARKDENLILPASCIAYFLLIPLMVGVARGNSFSDIARDVAPLMFMAVLPLLIKFLPQDRNAPQFRALLVAILVVGLVSALQFHLGIVKLFGSMDTYISKYDLAPASPEKGVSNNITFTLNLFGLGDADYQAFLLKCQDPAILFAAIYFLCSGLAFFLVKPRRFFFGLIALGGGSFCFYEFAALGMRAFSGLTVLAIIIYALYLVRSKKVPVGNLIVGGIFGLLLTHTQIINFSVQMWAKNQANGLSGRPAELYAAFDAISASFITFLFGVGWGGLVANPIYQGATTRYTHSLFSFWLLKTGVVGFAMLVLFVILLFRRVNLKSVWSSSHRLAVFLAASAVIIIGLFFEPTYKMLSFGLIVGLLLAELSLPTAPGQEMNTGKKPV